MILAGYSGYFLISVVASHDVTEKNAILLAVTSSESSVVRGQCLNGVREANRASVLIVILPNWLRKWVVGKKNTIITW